MVPLLLFVCAFAAGGDPAIPGMSGSVGYSSRPGIIRAGCYAPVSIDLATQGEPFEGQITIKSISGVQRAFEPLLSIPCELGVNSTKRFTGLFPVNQKDDSLVAELWSHGTKVGELHLGMSVPPESRSLILALAESDGRLSHLASSQDPLPARRRAITYGEPDWLPSHARAYDMVDAVILDGASLATLTVPQIDALKAWLESGGQLVVCSGSTWPLLKLSKFLMELLPVNPEESVSIPSPFPSRQSEAPTTATSQTELPRELLVCRAPLRGNAGPVERLMEVKGLDFPLIARRPVGAGSLTFLAFRLDEALIRDLPDFSLDAFFASVLPRRQKPLFEGLRQDEADQIDGELKKETLLPLPSSDAVGAAFSLYLLFFLPLAYEGARRRKSRAWPWFALPAGFIAASLVVFSYGRADAGRQRSFVQLTVLEATEDSRAAKGVTFANLYSPSHDRFRVESRQLQDMFGALQTTPLEGAKPLAFTYTIEPSAGILDLDIPGLASRSFVHLFTQPLPGEGSPGNLIYTKQSRQSAEDPFQWEVIGESVSGLTANATKIALRQAAFVALGRAQDLGDLRPGQAIPVRLDRKSGISLVDWGRRRLRGMTSADLSASQGLANLGRSALAGRLPDAGEGWLIGWSDGRSDDFTAFSDSGLGAVSSSTATNIAWTIQRIPLAAQGGTPHLESGDFEIQAWNSQEKSFHWEEREAFYEALDLTGYNDDWRIRFKPRAQFRSSGGEAREPIQSAWGSIVPRWGGKVEIFDFTRRQWGDPPAAQGGRIVLAPATGYVDWISGSGEVWLRIQGSPYELKDASFDVSMNYSLRR